MHSKPRHLSKTQDIFGMRLFHPLQCCCDIVAVFPEWSAVNFASLLQKRVEGVSKDLFKRYALSKPFIPIVSKFENTIEFVEDNSGRASGCIR